MAETRWLDPLETRAWRGWLAASDLIRAQTGRDLWHDSGFSVADYVVLVYLSETPGHQIRMSDLAAALRWSKSRLSHQVTRMEQRGLLTRAECPSDARGSFAVLTERGMAEIEAAAPHHVDSVRRNFIDLLTPEQLSSLNEITEVVISHLLSLPGAPVSAEGLPYPCATGPAEEGKLVG
ncbi:MAG: MarR family winged helix-turn-helix transcriptional regulator [Actinomycetota bacterium]|nr:MarR family winged helix-turn-helix transcriptional regulator [Actinomycetota bacterium]